MDVVPSEGQMSKCADPVLCYTQGNSRKFRHYSLANPLIKVRHQQVFDCGKCIFCRRKKSRELAVRCVLHASLYNDNCFLTLTYDEKKEGYHNELDYTDIQKFKKRLRQHCFRTDRRRIQVFNVHEYGQNGKKHWHLVVFNWTPHDAVLHKTSGGLPLYISKTLELLWPHGFSTVGTVTEASAMYQAQYTQKDIKNGNVTNSKKAKSNHSGIGREYFHKHYEQILSLGFIPFSGKKVPIPRYFHKLAHRHYAHFYDPDLFKDFPYRKAVYRPFKNGLEPNKHMADLFASYLIVRDERIRELTEEWDKEVKQNPFNMEKADFALSAENFLYDLKNRLQHDEF